MLKSASLESGRDFSVCHPLFMLTHMAIEW